MRAATTSRCTARTRSSTTGSSRPWPPGGQRPQLALRHPRALHGHEIAAVRLASGGRSYARRLPPGQSLQSLPPAPPQRSGLTVTWHPRAMDKVLMPVRDLTDSDQNQAVLDAASALAEGRAAVGDIEASHGPAVAAEGMSAARSRMRLGELAAPVHLTVVWAMYGETGRMLPRTKHPHGEDFVRAKVRQLDWLTDGLPGVTWSIVACDDGCTDRPSSADLMTSIAAAEGYPVHGHRSVTVL